MAVSRPSTIARRLISLVIVLVGVLAMAVHTGPCWAGVFTDSGRATFHSSGGCFPMLASSDRQWEGTSSCRS